MASLNSCDAGRKRTATGARLTQNDESNEGSDSETIGLNVGGRVFYTNRSTLTSGSSYFAARFNGPFNAGRSRRDENGFEVFFLDANPDLFEHVLDFLRRGIITWPSKEDDPVLHERLTGEAKYLGVDSMLKSLRPPVYLIKPNVSGKGIMYWVGTKNGTQEYQNPFDTGELSFSGSLLKDVECGLKESNFSFDRQLWRSSRRNFVEYKPQCGNFQGKETFVGPASEIVKKGGWYECFCFILRCSHGTSIPDLVITLKNVEAKPTHYSLRYAECTGMKSWNFEASTDGKSWVTLHQARNETSIASTGVAWEEIKECFIERCQGVTHISEKLSIATEIAEEKLRGTWNVDASSFFKYFRFVAMENYGYCGLHGCGFEFYGEVKNVTREDNSPIRIDYS